MKQDLELKCFYRFFFVSSKHSRLEHIKMYEKHKGHESMHMEMVVILLVTLIIAQVVLVEWKKRHYRSYSVRLWPHRKQ